MIGCLMFFIDTNVLKVCSTCEETDQLISNDLNLFHVPEDTIKPYQLTICCCFFSFSYSSFIFTQGVSNLIIQNIIRRGVIVVLFVGIMKFPFPRRPFRGHYLMVGVVLH